MPIPARKRSTSSPSRVRYTTTRAGRQYVQKVGERLVAYSSEPNGEFHFTVVDMPDVNAFAVPDGYIFVYRGLLAYLESEDQLAAVIGHEIGHVVAHHATKKSADERRRQGCRVCRGGDNGSGSGA